MLMQGNRAEQVASAAVRGCHAASASIVQGNWFYVAIHYISFNYLHLMILDILGFQLWAKRHTASHAGGFSSAVYLANLTNLMLSKLNSRGQERVDSYSLLWCLLPSCNVLIPAS